MHCATSSLPELRGRDRAQMTRRDKPTWDGQSRKWQEGIKPIELRLDLPLPADSPFAEPDTLRQPTPLRPAARSALPLVGAGAVALVLGWTIYYDLLARHPATVAPPAAMPPLAGTLAAIPFPDNGTVFADYQAADMAGPGLTVQTPGSDPSLLYVLALEDWQTGAHVCHVFLTANTLETIRMPPGRYRTVVASGQAWYGQQRLFGPETRVDETLRPIKVTAAQASPQRLTWGTDPTVPMTRVPVELFNVLLAGRR